MRKPEDIKKHIVHCSDSNTGNAAEIDRWHKARGWSGIGYHFVILRDGTLEYGRPLHQMGAHVQGHNRDSIGNSLIGKKEFTDEQFKTLRMLHRVLKGIMPWLELYGHRDFTSAKTCPNFNVREVVDNA